jgi:hypothetical protein
MVHIFSLKNFVQTALFCIAEQSESFSQGICGNLSTRGVSLDELVMGKQADTSSTPIFVHFVCSLQSWALVVQNAAQWPTSCVMIHAFPSGQSEFNLQALPTEAG